MEDITDKIRSLLSDEESLGQIKELAAMLSGEAEDTGGDGGESADSGFSAPLALMRIMSAAGTASAEDKDSELILALRPHLSPEKQLRADRALRLLKLYNIFTALRDSGALDELEKML